MSDDDHLDLIFNILCDSENQIKERMYMLSTFHKRGIKHMDFIIMRREEDTKDFSTYKQVNLHIPTASLSVVEHIGDRNWRYKITVKCTISRNTYKMILPLFNKPCDGVSCFISVNVYRSNVHHIRPVLTISDADIEMVSIK